MLVAAVNQSRLPRLLLLLLLRCLHRGAPRSRNDFRENISRVISHFPSGLQLPLLVAESVPLDCLVVYM